MLEVQHPRKQNVKIKLKMPGVGRHKFTDGNINYMLVKPTGVPVPTTLAAVVSASELECAIPNCTNKAEH